MSEVTEPLPSIGRAHALFAYRHNARLTNQQVDIDNNQLSRLSENQLLDASNGRVLAIRPTNLSGYLKSLGLLDDFGVWNISAEAPDDFQSLLTVLSAQAQVTFEAADFNPPTIPLVGTFLAFTLSVNPDSLVWTGSVKIHYRVVSASET